MNFEFFENELIEKTKELEKQQLENDKKIKELLKQAPNILKEDTILNLFSELDILQSDSKTFRSDVNQLKQISEKLNNNVNKVKTVWNNVKDCCNQLDELMHLKTSSEVIGDLIERNEIEAAAENVCRYLEIESVIPNPLFDRMKNDQQMEYISKWTNVMDEATVRLKTLVLLEFEKAVKEMDVDSVQRFCKIAFLIGMQNDCIRLLCEFLKKKLDESCAENIKFARNLSRNDKRFNLIFDEVLALLFESIGILIEENRTLVESYFGYGKLLVIVEFLQNECDQHAGTIIQEMHKNRSLNAIKQTIADSANALNRNQAQKLDLKNLDILVEELSLMLSRFELYFRFIEQKTLHDIKKSTNENSQKDHDIEKLKTLMSTAKTKSYKSEITTSYLVLEKYFLEESIGKAIELDSCDTDQKNSSVVDDVFFLINKCLKRAITSCSIDVICPVIEKVCSIIEHGYNDLLQRRLKINNSRSTLDTIHAYTIGKTVQFNANKHQMDDIKNYTIGINNFETSLEFVTEISGNLLQRQRLPVNLTSDENVRLQQAFQKFENLQEKFRKCLELALQQLLFNVIRPKITSWMDPFALISFQMSEEELLRYEASESFVQTLIQNLDSLIGLMKTLLLTKGNEQLLNMIMTESTTQLEILIRKTKFNRLGGLVLDKELRQLASYATNAVSWSARDKFSRILQIGAILNVESVTEIYDYYETMPYKFTQDELKKLLQLRSDIKMDEIRKLSLK